MRIFIPIASRSGQDESSLSNSTARRSCGLTLIEVLISLVLAGILLALVSELMGQVVLNNQALVQRSQTGSSVTVLRRIMHRDFLDLKEGSLPSITSEGLQYRTLHSMFISFPLEVRVNWLVEGSRLIRVERAPSLDLQSRIIFSDTLQSFDVRFMDGGGKWRSGQNIPPDLRAVEFKLNLGGGPKTFVQALPGYF